MRSNSKIAVGGLAGLLFVSAATLLTAGENPYRDIVTRNLFSLLPPDPPKKEEEAKPPTNVKLTGITTMFSKRALLLVQETGPGAKAEKSVVLREGEREGEIEVLEIDERAGAVKIKNGGVVSTLNFDRDGMKAAELPPAVVPPANNPQAGSVNIATPGGQPGQTATTTAIAQPRPVGGLRQIPTRALRLPPTPPPTLVPNESPSGGNLGEGAQPQVGQ